MFVIVNCQFREFATKLSLTRVDLGIGLDLGLAQPSFVHHHDL